MNANRTVTASFTVGTGAGVDTVGLYNPATGVFYLRNSNSAGFADVTFTYGPAGAGWIPLVGDWDSL
jgi:hypothetical protein